MKFRYLLPMASLALSSWGLKAQLPASLKTVVDTATTEQAVFGPFLTNAIKEGGGIKSLSTKNSDTFYYLQDGSRAAYEVGPDITTVTHRVHKGENFKSLTSGDSPNDGEMTFAFNNKEGTTQYITVTLPKMAKNTSETSDTALIKAKFKYLVTEMSRLRKGEVPIERVTQTEDSQGNVKDLKICFTFAGPKGKEPYVELQVSEGFGYQLYWRPTESTNNPHYLWSGGPNEYDGYLWINNKKIPVSKLQVESLGYGLSNQ